MRRPRKRYAYHDDIFRQLFLKYGLMRVNPRSVDSSFRCALTTNQFSYSYYCQYPMIEQIMTKSVWDVERNLQRIEADYLKCEWKTVIRGIKWLQFVLFLQLLRFFNFLGAVILHIKNVHQNCTSINVKALVISKSHVNSRSWQALSTFFYSQLYTVVTFVECKDFKGLQTENIEAWSFINLL